MKPLEQTDRDQEDPPIGKKAHSGGETAGPWHDGLVTLSQMTTANPVRAADKPLILIVDDEPSALLFHSAVLEKAGFRVKGFQKGSDVFSAFMNVKPDLVILDLVMPELNGFTICRTIRNLPGSEYTPILVVSGKGDPRSIKQAFEAGATDFLLKPVNLDLLGNRIQYMLRSSQTMKNLKRSEQSLRNAHRIAKLGNWELDIDKDYLWCSDEIFHLFGIKPENFERSYAGLLTSVHPEDRKVFDSKVKDSLRAGDPFSLEHRILRHDGSLCVINQQVEVSFLGGGKALRMIGTAQDVTDKRKSEDSLKLLKEAVERLPIGITISDLEGKIIYTNPAEAQMHGYTLEELSDKEARMFAPAKLKKSVPPDEFHKLKVWKRETVNLRKKGETHEEFPVYLTSIPVKNAEEVPLGFITTCEDITERKQAEREIEKLAYQDILTGLPNRALFQDRLEKAIALARREGRQLCVMFLDLDRFKDVNDSQGHVFGDKLLWSVAERLRRCIREADTLARMGGDEFVIVFTSVEASDQAAMAAERILSVFSQPFELEGRQIYSSTSIGIAMYPSDGSDVSDLLKSADTAMYYAKSRGRHTYRFFSREMNRRVMEKVSIENGLRRAIDGNEFFLHYQPQVDLETGRIIGVESLIRWESPELGWVLPSQFIPASEDAGIIFRLGQWVLDTAFAQAKAWQEAGLRSLKVAVNISGHQFKQPGFMDMVDRVIRDTGVDPYQIEFELTESVIMDKADRTIETLKELKTRGIHLCIDDFGTGYSSLSYLKHFPADRIKIDRSFVTDIRTNADDAAIVDMIIAIGKSLGLKVLAEGVENEEQLNFLKAHGCAEAQGYLFARSMAAEELTVVLSRDIPLY